MSFELVEQAVAMGSMLDDLEHPQRLRYPRQRIFVVEIGGYAHLAPYIEEEHRIVLKTIIPSRKATKKYLGDKK